MSAVGHCDDITACEGFLGVLERQHMQRSHYLARNWARAHLCEYLKQFHNLRMRCSIARRGRDFQAARNPSVETG